MYFIAHRGNLFGPDKEQENKVEYILKAIFLKFDVEIDVWYINNKLYLGHDFPQYEIELNFLIQNRDYLWCHCKNLQAFELLLSNNIHCFIHDKDIATLTSKGFVWTYPNTLQINNSICVLPEIPPCSLEQGEQQNNDINKCIGFCSDYIFYLREKCSKK